MDCKHCTTIWFASSYCEVVILVRWRLIETVRSRWKYELFSSQFTVLFVNRLSATQNGSLVFEAVRKVTGDLSVWSHGQSQIVTPVTKREQSPQPASYHIPSNKQTVIVGWISPSSPVYKALSLQHTLHPGWNWQRGALQWSFLPPETNSSLWVSLSYSAHESTIHH